MKTTIVALGNPDYRTIHCDRPICDDYISTEYHFDSDKKHPWWVASILSVYGVKSIHANKFELTIVKGRIFNWVPILCKALVVLAEAFPEEINPELLDAALVGQIKTEQEDED